MSKTTINFIKIGIVIIVIELGAVLGIMVNKLNYNRCDVNHDGIVDISDLALVKSYLLREEK